MMYSQIDFCFGLLRSQAIISDQNKRIQNLINWKVHFSRPWELITMQNSTLPLFSNVRRTFL